jgi:hypothetical protein
VSQHLNAANYFEGRAPLSSRASAVLASPANQRNRSAADNVSGTEDFDGLVFCVAMPNG